MADKKITELTETLSVSDGDFIPIVDPRQDIPSSLRNQKVKMSVIKAYMASGAGYATRTGITGESLSIRTLVILKDNKLYAFDPTDVTHYGLLVGFLIVNPWVGASTYVTSGIYESEFLSLTPNSIYYSDSDGKLTTVTPAEGIYQEVGFAVTANRIFINLGQPSLITEAAVEYTQAEKNKLGVLSELRKDPVQSQAVLKSLPQSLLDDKEDRLVENEGGYYRYDAHSSGSEDGALAPDDQTGGVGFWIPVGFSGNVSADKITETTDRQFVTSTEKAKLNLDYGYFDNTTALNTAHPTGVDGAYVRIGATDTIWVWSTDTTSWVDSSKPITGYIHPNHTGDVTSNGDGQTTISEGAVTFAKINSATKAASGEESASKLVVANDSRLRSKYRGRHLTLAALQTSHSTGLSGDWAEVKPNGGMITEYVWDGGWIPRPVGSSLTSQQEDIINSVGDATQLNTTSKILVGAINEVLAAIGGVGALTSEDIDTLAEINAIINDADVASETFVTNLTGALASLNTTVKTSLVAAINELITWIKEPKAYAVIKPTGVIDYYDDLHSAIAGSVAGDTIELYNDYVSTSTLVMKDGITIDTNGHSIINNSISLASYTLYSDSPNVSLNVIGNGKIIRRGIVSTTNSFAPTVWLTNNSTNNIVNIDADIIHDTRQALIVQGEGSVVKVYGHVYGAAQDSQNRTTCIVDKATVEIFNDVIAKSGSALGAHVGANVIIHGNLIVESGNEYPVMIGYNNIAESALTVYGNLIKPLGATGGTIYFYNDAEVKIGGAIVNSSGTEAVVHANVVEAKVTFLGPPAYNGTFPPEVTVSSIGTYGTGTVATSDGSSVTIDMSTYVAGYVLAAHPTTINTLIFVEGGSSTNQSPTANAGTNQSITLPTDSIQLNGSGTDSDGTIASYAWTQQSGANTATFSSTSIANPTVSGLIEGTYVFRLTVTDNEGATGFDDVTITVNAAANVAPTANAGTDAEITLPTNSIQLDGSGSDSDGTIESYSWTQQAGPGAATFNDDTIADPTVSNLIEGSYIFRLTVTDDDGATDTDDVTITVNGIPAPEITADSLEMGEITVTLQ